VWSNNVEIIAASRIGMGTVAYVNNIYKYYIAYKLIEEQNEQKRRPLSKSSPSCETNLHLLSLSMQPPDARSIGGRMLY
jgi:hypothetical protein